MPTPAKRSKYGTSKAAQYAKAHAQVHPTHRKVNTCGLFVTGGGRCQRPSGHRGKHQRG